MKIFGNLDVRGNHNIIAFDPWPDQNNPYSGFTIRESSNNVYGLTISDVGCALYFRSNYHRWEKAIANNVNTMPAIGVSAKREDDGSWIILLWGSLYCSRYHWDDRFLYVSESVAGQITTTQPSQTGSIVQQIGYTRNNDVGFFHMCPTIIEIG